MNLIAVLNDSVLSFTDLQMEYWSDIYKKQIQAYHFSIHESPIARVILQNYLILNVLVRFPDQAAMEPGYSLINYL